MRVAVLIIGLCLVLVIGLQSCTVMVGGGITENKELASSGATGILIAFLYILGSAFALGIPIISTIVFALAAGIGFLAGSSSEFKDMTFWAYVSSVLAVMSFLGSRKKK